MKKILIIVLFLFSQASYSYCWEHCNPEIKNESSYCLNAFGNRIFVGADSGRIYFSNDNGDNWNVINTGYSYVSIKTLDLLENTIFAGTDSIGILLSSDKGDSWTKSSLGDYSIRILKSKGSSIYAGTLNGDFLISRENGVNWIKSNLSDKPITCMSLSADNMCVGTLGGGVFLSKDNGNRWIKCKADPLGVSYIFSILIDHDNIYKGGVGGFSVSTDLGLSWKSKKIPGTEVSSVNSILIIDSNLIAGTSHPMENLGVIQSSDNGDTWHDIGLYTLEINDLAFNSEYIFAIDNKGKIFRRKLNEIIKTDMQDDKLSPLESNISPNPASDFIIISVGANGRSPLQSDIKILNIYGQTVFSVGAIHELPLRVDISGLAPGMYFVRIGDRVSKFIKI
jgi:photosystem II stability/assembly factor-like uncharacterized protein